MLSTIFGIQSSDPDQRSRGLLLKCITIIFGLAILSSFTITILGQQIAQKILIGDIIMLLLSVVVFALAHVGRVSLGAMVLAIPLMLSIFINLPPNQLLERPSMVTLFFPMMIIGLTVHARAAAIFSGITLLSTITLLTIGYIPFTSFSIIALVLLVMTMVFIWLIIFTMERSRDSARAQAATIQQSKDLLQASERDLQSTNQQIQQKNDQLEHALNLVQQLEVPVIPLIAGAVVVPIVGYLDNRRLDAIQRNVLYSIHTHNARFVLIDLTGLAQFDSEIIRQFQRLVQGISLLGAEALLTGISAEIAASLIDNEISFDHIWTSGNLSSAIRYVLQNATV